MNAIRKTGVFSIPVGRLHASRHAIAVSAVLTAAAILSAGDAQSGMVRCASASKPAEFVICNSENLQVLDSKVDGAFKRQYAAAGNAFKMQSLNQSHEAWTRERDVCRNDPGCIERHFRTRLNALVAGEKPVAKPVAAFKRFTETAQNGN